ncbi:spore maturation protein B [Natranaerovirga hydrolytica]|uniref:Spore maturation protein B n=1 Tax=Natranaerovirga hydrolytica TaxID=680378 RepID=A0A4R1N237_9FIRM|nr:nucleoside recognition domain-containing protein [Natranaerovirga hydrolytica]TCL00047.1 spore maturation protein B [Natranaerovirga hydrolytica]
MNIILYLSNFMIPLVFVYIIGFGLLSKVNVFDVFVKGVMDGFKVVLNIMPTLIGLMVAVGILRASGALDFLTMVLTPITNLVKFPSELVPIALMRTVSSSAATGLVLDLFKTYGPDSTIGRMVSVMMGCTETIFYTLSVYFLAVNIKKTRYTITGALLANIAGIIFSVFITYRLFG